MAVLPFGTRQHVGYKAPESSVTCPSPALRLEGSLSYQSRVQYEPARAPIYPL